MIRRVEVAGLEERWVCSAVRIGAKGEPDGAGDGERYFGGELDAGISRRFVRSNAWQKGRTGSWLPEGDASLDTGCWTGEPTES